MCTKFCKSTFRWVVISLIVFSMLSCRKVQDLKAFTQAQYTLEAAQNMTLNGLDVTNRKSLSDFKAEEGDSLLQALNTNQLRLSGLLWLGIDMPEPEQVRNMKVVKLKWQLLVDGKRTLEGIITKPMLLKNGSNRVPVNSSVTLAEVDGFQNYEGFSKLTTLLSQNRDLRNYVTFRIKPTVDTPVGDIELPDFITISKPSNL
jgi:hypothetical protein